jgi:hypothetical protein
MRTRLGRTSSLQFHAPLLNLASLVTFSREWRAFLESRKCAWFSDRAPSSEREQSAVQPPVGLLANLMASFSPQVCETDDEIYADLQRRCFATFRVATDVRLKAE